MPRPAMSNEMSNEQRRTGQFAVDGLDAAIEAVRRPSGCRRDVDPDADPPKALAIGPDVSSNLVTRPWGRDCSTVASNEALSGAVRPQ